MTKLSKYLQGNKKEAYAYATSNTSYNNQGCPVISKDDEWVKETEWDELFNALKNKQE